VEGSVSHCSVPQREWQRAGESRKGGGRGKVTKDEEKVHRGVKRMR